MINTNNILMEGYLFNEENSVNIDNDNLIKEINDKYKNSEKFKNLIEEGYNLCERDIFNDSIKKKVKESYKDDFNVISIDIKDKIKSFKCSNDKTYILVNNSGNIAVICLIDEDGNKIFFTIKF